MIEHILSIHSNKNNLFNIVKNDYVDALKLRGYKYELKYMDQKINSKKKKKCIWLNPMS